MPESDTDAELLEGTHKRSWDDGDEDVEANLICPHPISNVLSLLPCCWICWMGSVKTLNQNEHAAVMCWGEYVGSITSPGLMIINPVGVELRKISVQKQALNLQDLKCNDARGSPIHVSGSLTYRLRSAKRAVVDIQNVGEYISDTAARVLRRVCARFPYESAVGPSLRGTRVVGSPGAPGQEQMDDHTVADELRATLERDLAEAGVEVIKFELTDLSYAPEIAASMLQKQQAEAMVLARQVVVQSAVQISHDAIVRMKELGHQITPQGEEKIINNLLTVICSDRGSQPVVPLEG